MSVESRIPEAVRNGLAAKGQVIRAAGAWSLGDNAAIVINLVTGVLNAGADPRTEAYAWAR